MKNIIFIFAALLVAVLGSSSEEMLDSSETFTKAYPFAQRAFFYYPTGSEGYVNREGNPAPSSVDFMDNPFNTVPESKAQEMMPNPAAYFVPTSDLLAMPYPSRSDQEADEKAAMKHLEMLKGLHDELEKSEEKFLKPSMSFGGSAVTLPTNAFMSLLHKLSKTVTKTVITTQVTTVFVSVTPSNTTSETTDSVTIVPSNTDIKATGTPLLAMETVTLTSTITESTSATVEPTSSVVETTTELTATTTEVDVETSSTTSASVTTTPPTIIVTTITSTIL